jgi:hypothetical protein
VAELKLKSKNESESKWAVFEFTYTTKIPISIVEDSVTGWETSKVPHKFTGRTDQDLVEWIRKIINEFHDGDPIQFIDDWDLYRGDMVSFDIKLEK